MRKRSGFSLVEITTVLAIIGMVLAIAVPSFLRSNGTSRDGALRANLGVIRAALVACYQDTGYYPASLSELTLTSPSSTSGYTATGQLGTITTSDWRGPYLSNLPTDPVSGAAFTYFASGSSGIPAGSVQSSATGNDASGTAYNSY